MGLILSKGRLDQSLGKVAKRPHHHLKLWAAEVLGIAHEKGWLSQIGICLTTVVHTSSLPESFYQSKSNLHWLS